MFKVFLCSELILNEILTVEDAYMTWMRRACHTPGCPSRTAQHLQSLTACEGSY